jgi:hypothetical protein
MDARITIRVKTIVEMSALAHATQEHHALIAQAVARISKKGF